MKVPHLSKIIPLALLILTACAELDWNPLDPTFVPEKINARIPATLTLSYDLETLQEIRPGHQDKLLRDPFRKLDGTIWNDKRGTSPRAALRLVRPLEEIGIETPPSPKSALQSWPDLAWRSHEFLDLYESRNIHGNVQWSRLMLGGTLCVFFSQWVPEYKSAFGTARLDGYYCVPAGDTFTPGQAETVIQSVKIAP